MRSLVVLVVLAATAAAAPKLESPAAIVIDAATGAELYAKHADDVRPIASLTKLFVALALRDAHLPLDGWTEIAPVDALAAAGGAHSLLAVGHEFGHRDLLYAMLLVSDNRVPSALARAAGLSDLLARMRAIAADLGLAHTKLADATGIAGNASTARELALAMRQVVRDPVLREIMTTRVHRVVSRDEAVTIDYKTTVPALYREIRAGKTGWTSDAGYCVVVAMTIKKRTVVIALLGADHKDARATDIEALADWLAGSTP